ncbi:hypothetical protein HanIR_Chr02g0082461 [Helianthus annuus]|nr:hypothetical protein HanIR_Chr02g0082461 [Helianthus annuus]
MSGARIYVEIKNDGVKRFVCVNGPLIFIIKRVNKIVLTTLSTIHQYNYNITHQSKKHQNHSTFPMSMSSLWLDVLSTKTPMSLFLPAPFQASTSPAQTPSYFCSRKYTKSLFERPEYINCFQTFEPSTCT